MVQDAETVEYQILNVPLSTAIKFLEQKLEQYGEFAQLENFYVSGDSNDTELVINYTRLESDKEFNDRTAFKERIKLNKEYQKQKEYKKYLKLKAKFENEKE